jgi:hypothetical protein
MRERANKYRESLGWKSYPHTHIQNIFFSSLTRLYLYDLKEQSCRRRANEWVVGDVSGGGNDVT